MVLRLGVRSVLLCLKRSFEFGSGSFVAAPLYAHALLRSDEHKRFAAAAACDAHATDMSC